MNKKRIAMKSRIRLNDIFVLEKHWKFHYASLPYEVTWKKGALFRIVGFQKLYSEQILLELEDEHGRIVHMTSDIAEVMFSKRMTPVLIHR